MSTSLNDANSISNDLTHSSAKISKLISREFFLNLIHNHSKHSPKLKNIFNKNNVKASYSCAKNINQYISVHSTLPTYKRKKKTLPQVKNATAEKNKPRPLSGKCMNKTLVYIANIQYEDQIKCYVCSTENH